MKDWDAVDPSSLRELDSELFRLPIVEPPLVPVSIPQEEYGKDN